MAQPRLPKFLTLGFLIACAGTAGLLRPATEPESTNSRPMGPAPRPQSLPVLTRPGGTPNPGSATTEAPGRRNKRIAGPDRERRFFDDWHGDDYGAVLPPEVLEAMSTSVRALAREQDQLLGGTGWELLGPSGMKTAAPTLYSGRILDIDYRIMPITIDFWFAAASGGLWHYDGLIDTYTPLTEDLPTQAVGTVSVDPTDPLKIVIGTGEFGIRGGLGIFRSTDGGATWTAATGDPTEPVHRIRHITSSRLVCAAADGWFVSTDGGASWTQNSPGVFFDIALHPTSTDTLYTTAVYNATTGAIWRSSDSGQTFDGGSVAVPNGYRGAVALCASNPSVVYGVFSTPFPTTDLAGIVKTTSSGSGGWGYVASGSNHLSGQGWYNNTIAVDPDDPQHVYVGGVYLKESLNGGGSWTDLPYDPASGLHADFHALEYTLFDPTVAGSHSFPGGTGEVQRGITSQYLLLGHDGGWTVDAGLGFNATLNRLPITQYVHVHAAQYNRLVVGGGSQDNGMSITTDGGANWFFRQGGDGSALSIDPNNTNRMWSAVGVYDEPLLFRRHRTTDAGLNWTYINTGIDTAYSWYPDVENDQVAPVYLYTSADRKLLKSTDYGDSWFLLTSPFATNIVALKVGRYSGAQDAAVWVTLDNGTAGDRIWVLDSGLIQQRDGGLPAGVKFRAVIPHPVQPNTAYALVNGFEAPGQKIWRTTDRGLTWTNVTGNLPNVPLGSIVGHPTNPNELYLGTELGCFRGFFAAGQWRWITWNQGMPDAAIVTDLTWVDNLGTTGQFWVIAGTYGRSMYQREVSDLDVSAVPPDVLHPPTITLAQNTPNPVRLGATTRITFALPKAGTVSLRVFDVSGRVVTTLADGHLEPGPHEFFFRPDGLVPGVYFYRLEAGGAVQSKKMIVRR